MIKTIFIIFNPNSTGGAEENSRTFQERVHQDAPDIACKLMPTKHAGHAKILAQECANKHRQCMIVSSSGDGGYNEVVNGVLTSHRPEAVVGVLPSGNANDHYHYHHRPHVIDRIQKGEVECVDILRLTVGKRVRYAHSYIGIGITSDIGKVLTKNRLTPLKEAWLVFIHLFQKTPVKIRVNGKKARYDSLVFHVIGRMSKYMKLTRPKQGMFGVFSVKAGSLLGLLHRLIHASTLGLQDEPQTGSYEFVALHSMSVQLDGEVMKIKKRQKVVVECIPQALHTIV